MSQKIKKRNPNFSSSEKSLLLHCVYEERGVIENKKTDAATWKDKESAWLRIETNFNSQSGASCYRSGESLKRFYANYKGETRKEAAQEKFSCLQTGGGKQFKPTDPNFELAISIMNPKTVHGLENEFDGDSQSNERSENIDNNPNQNNDWSSYKPSMLKKGINPKLKPPIQSTCDPKLSEANEQSISGEDVEKEKTPKVIMSKGFKKSFESINQEINTPWMSKKRPVASSVPNTKITEQYTELSRIKIELAKLQYDTLKEEAFDNKYQRNIEHELKKKSMELDIQIKTELLKKIKKESCTAKDAQNVLKEIEVYFDEISQN
ncbi:uncharacterized protein LOC129909529 [Episyrphus balteatus]|uniref:uncharacterized protein LOC129909529 n=1 Tax=Episyrphus balteatus TaxID=286459 RepID=UPI002486246A|nr:uncharacterized protein LOC129909529 [Episyrphus balteatus]